VNKTWKLQAKHTTHVLHQHSTTTGSKINKNIWVEFILENST